MLQETEKRGRIEWLDLGKGFAMALVLLGHSMRDGMRQASPALDLIYRIVYIFHMTYFFWMSGCTYSLSRGRGQKPMMAAARRIKKQLAPCWATRCSFTPCLPWPAACRGWAACSGKRAMGKCLRAPICFPLFRPITPSRIICGSCWCSC